MPRNPSRKPPGTISADLKKWWATRVEILNVLMISHVYHVCIHTSDGALVKMIERGFFNKSGEGHAAVAKQVSLHGAPISQSH